MCAGRIPWPQPHNSPSGHYKIHVNVRHSTLHRQSRKKAKHALHASPSPAITGTKTLPPLETAPATACTAVAILPSAQSCCCWEDPWGAMLPGGCVCWCDGVMQPGPNSSTSRFCRDGKCRGALQLGCRVAGAMYVYLQSTAHDDIRTPSVGAHMHWGTSRLAAKAPAPVR